MKLLRKVLNRGVFVCALLVAGLGLTGCISYSDGPIFTDSPQPPIQGSSGSSTNVENHGYADRLRVGETVTVDLFSTSNDQIPSHTEPIKEDGTITMPLIGKVVAAGKTPGVLQNDIHNLYVPKYYVRLTVTVSAPQRVYYVGGEVKQPGRQAYMGETTVTKAIQVAGDFTDFANEKKVKLIRANGQVITVNCKKALRDPTLDPPVYPGDQIQVPRRIW